MTKHTILFLAANDAGAARARAIQNELAAGTARERFAFVTRFAATSNDLLSELRKLKPTVVHYCGDGNQQGLYFQAENGPAQLVSTAALAETFGATGDSVKLLVLDADHSELHADALLPHVGCVVGVSGRIGDEAACSFASGFYGGLGDSQSVEAAYRQGLAATSLKGSSARDRIRLRSRARVDVRQLVLAETALDGAVAASVVAASAVAASAVAASAAGSARRAEELRPSHELGGAVPGATRTDGAGRTCAPIGASPAVRDRLDRMKRNVADTLRGRVRALEQLAARIGCDPDPEVVFECLVNLRGGVVAQHVLAVFDAQPATPEGDADRDALRSVLFNVLPYVTDWRDEVAACCARGKGQPDGVELRYRSDTIAEAVMAGWAGRRCYFEHRPGAEPCGVGAVQIPATAQTALFVSEQHLREGVVLQLRRQLGTGGLDLDEQRLEVEAELRVQGERVGVQRMRYYFVFHDAASPGAPDALWRLARTTLHSETGLPSLVLVRMNGQLDLDQAALNRLIAALLTPRMPPP